MRGMPKEGRLQFWQDRYQLCKDGYDTERTQMLNNLDQYEGKKTTDVNGVRGRDATVGRNITYELIESQVSSGIPIPKVQPMKVGDRFEERARIVEEMLNAKIDQLPFEYLHDESSRTVPALGGNFFLCEWDNGIKTRETVGDLSIQSVSPVQFTPQKGVHWLHRMDYLFLEFTDTRERLYARYGIDLKHENTDETTDNPLDTVTQIVCYYVNEDGSIGEFRWVGDTVLVDLDDCQTRYWDVCKSCGKAKPYNTDECVCGSKEWVKQPKDYEELKYDLVLSDGRVVPAMSPEKDEDGNEVYETVDIEQPFIQNGQTLMENGMPAMVKVSVQQPKMAPTRIPYYAPRRFPVILQKNTSRFGKLLGDSDCEQIHDIQVKINQLLSNISEKLLKGGSLVGLPRNLRVEPDGTIGKVVKFENPADFNSIQCVNLTTDIQQDLLAIEHLYNYAKRLLGISDSFQGMPDKTAESGVSKQIQVQQSAGRLESKRVMEDAAYADLFQTMFQFMLAYTDEPREFRAESADGKPISRIFSRYDFLEQDEFGGWYYDDQYLFSTDISGSLANNRQMMWQETRMNYQSGAFGDPMNPLTLKVFWEELEALHYPNASRIIQRIQEMLEQQQLIQQMQQQIQMLEQQLAETQGAYQQTTDQLNQAQTERDEYGQAINQASEAIQGYENQKMQSDASMQREIEKAYFAGIAKGASNATPKGDKEFEGKEERE